MASNNDIFTLVKSIDKKLTKVDSRLTKVEKNMPTKTELRKLKKSLMEHISKVATTTPTMRMFSKLKEKVEIYHPSS